MFKSEDSYIKVIDIPYLEILVHLKKTLDTILVTPLELSDADCDLLVKLQQTAVIETITKL